MDATGSDSAAFERFQTATTDRRRADARQRTLAQAALVWEEGGEKRIQRPAQSVGEEDS